MNNSDLPTFPTNGYTRMIGLTKREYFAVTILSGLSVMAISGIQNLTENQKKELIPKAIELADELLKQLQQ